jgi:hypothetical protein
MSYIDTYDHVVPPGHLGHAAPVRPDDILEKPHVWSIDIETYQYRFSLDLWTDFTISWNHEGATTTVEMNVVEPMLGYIRDLVTDLVFKRDRVPLFRFRILASEDVMTRDASTTRFTCATYESILARRVVYDDWVLRQADVDAAWTLVNYTQTKPNGDLGIVRGTMPAGVDRQRTLTIGTTIRDAINDFATDEQGFDWWVDVDKVFHVAKPRRGTDRSAELQWMAGGEIAELTRTNPTDEYASQVLAVGARNETRIPDGAGGETVYPPPPPQRVFVDPMPLGLWDTAISYSDTVTTASLLGKADYELANRVNLRPYYKMTLGSGIWAPPIGLGDVIMLRIQLPPRADIRVPVRIEEMEFAVTVDGGETVSIAARAEEPETFVGGHPLGPIPVVPLDPPNGRTNQMSRLRPWDDLGAVLKGIDRRVGIQERLPEINGGGGSGGGGGVDEVWVGPDVPPASQELWYDTDAVPPTLKVFVSGAWVPVTSPGVDEVWIGTDDPIAAHPTIELWYDSDASDTGDAVGYTHYQSVASSVWTINHPLKFMPNVAIVDSSGREAIADHIDWTSATQVVVTFTAALAGQAYLS